MQADGDEWGFTAQPADEINFFGKQFLNLSPICQPVCATVNAKQCRDQAKSCPIPQAMKIRVALGLGLEIRGRQQDDDSVKDHSSGGGGELFQRQCNFLESGNYLLTIAMKGGEMRQGKFKYLLVAMLVATGLLFAGGEVRAATFSYDLSFVSISNAGPTSADYTYAFTQTPGSTTLSYVDFEIPVDISLPVGPFPATGNANFTATLNGNGLSGEVYEIGIGDFGTKFGVGDTRYRVVKVNIPNPATNFSIVLQIKNQNLAPRVLTASPGVVLIKAGNGSNTQSFMINTPAVVNPPPPPTPVIGFFSVSNPVVAGGQLIFNWSVTNVTSGDINGTSIIPSSGTITLTAPDTAGNYPYTITFNNIIGGSTSTSSQTTNVQVEPAPPAPLIETTCKQIRKNPTSGNPICINLCLTTIDGVQQDIYSATWFNNSDCSGENGVALKVYGEDSPEKTLVCAPCDYTTDPNDPNPQACTTNINPGQTPFLYVQEGAIGNPYKNCDVFRFEKQDQGFAAVLGTDPWVVINGRQVWVK